MKLQNKKTGEIGYLVAGVGSSHYVVTNNELDSCGKYNSLAELNEEWEDYEEPKEYWFINVFGEVCKEAFDENNQLDNNAKTIGNYFETEEQAEKAVEKLKAWKRLKDKGFIFCGNDCINKNNVIYFEFGERPLTQSEADEADKDLDLLFGGEE